VCTNKLRRNLPLQAFLLYYTLNAQLSPDKLAKPQDFRRWLVGDKAVRIPWERADRCEQKDWQQEQVEET
jgi:hypothetical protein